MNRSDVPDNPHIPPRPIQCLAAGFNVTANHPALLVLPIALDLLLWFGPHFRLKSLLESDLLAFLQDMSRMGGADLAAMVPQLKEMYSLFLERFNLASILSSLPIGVPSLMTGLAPITNPLGRPLFIEVQSFGQVFYGFALFLLLGLVFGSLYFDQLARATALPVEKFSLQRAVWNTRQTLLLFVLLVIVLILLGMPAMLISFLLAIFGPGAIQIGLLLIGSILVPNLLRMVGQQRGRRITSGALWRTAGAVAVGAVFLVFFFWSRGLVAP